MATIDGSLGQNATCLSVNLLNSSWEQCEFIVACDDCKDEGSLLPYGQFLFCNFTIEDRPLGMVLLLGWLVLLFTGLGVTADDFLCPSLLVVSKHLKLSQNVAGVTLLAFGNGAVDIFTSLAGITHSRAELVIGELYGSGIFVTTVVAGCIFIIGDFSVMKRPVLRDIAFYLTATFMTWATYWHGFISFSVALTFIMVYCVYITVVIVGRIINKKLKSYNSDTNGDISVKLAKSQDSLNNREEIRCSHCKDWPHTNTCLCDDVSDQFDNRNMQTSIRSRRCRTISHGNRAIHHRLNNAIYAITHQDERGEVVAADHQIEEGYIERSGSSCLSCEAMDGSSREKVNFVDISHTEEELYLVDNEWIELLIHLCPIDFKGWSRDSAHYKIFQVIRSPVYFLLTLTVPVVDSGSMKQNWCRVLNSFHLISGPTFIAIISGQFYWTVPQIGIPLGGLVIGLGTILAAIVYCKSCFNNPPSFHQLFAYEGFIISIFWIYILAREVVSGLRTIGTYLNLSEFFLGLTVLSWGNCLGDLMSDLSMARQGFQRMALSACLGAPLLNMLLGVGIPYLMLTTSHPAPIQLHYTPMISLLYVTVTASLLTTLAAMFYCGFTSHRAHGYLLIGIYLTYLVFALLLEAGII